MATARMIVYKPEPIKSVEAVFLALYLTAGLLLVDRTPVCFKTKFEDEVCQHIVLLVQNNGKYGAFGISSNPDLMTKDFQFDSMSSIIENYLKAYKASAHTVLKIRIGLPVEHDIMSTHFICWRHLCLSPEVVSWPECVVEIENHALRMRRLWDLWVLTGKGDDPRKAKMARRKLDTNVNSKGKLPVERQPVVTTQVVPPPEMKKHVRAPISTRRQWDAESTGSNTDDCEHCEQCEQLKRAMPPSDTKRASVTTVKRMKTSGHHDTTAPGSKPVQRSTHSHSNEQQWEAESFESNTGEPAKLGGRTRPSVHFQPRLNHRSLAATKQILKNFVHSSALSTPPRRPSNRRSGARESIRKAATDPKLLPGEKSVRRKREGPLYSFTSAGGKSKAG